jgi:hypothetical protein
MLLQDEFGLSLDQIVERQELFRDGNQIAHVPGCPMNVRASPRRNLFRWIARLMQLLYRSTQQRYRSIRDLVRIILKSFRGN